MATEKIMRTAEEDELEAILFLPSGTVCPWIPA